MNNRFLTLLALAQLLILLVSCEVPSEIDKNAVANSKPTVTLTSNATADVFVGDQITFTASASDTDGNISKVEFYVDDVLKATDETTPFNYNWTAGPNKTTHNFKAVAYDDAKETNFSLLQVSVGNKLPGGTITYPANGGVVNSGVPITIKADATDIDGGVAKVEFYIDAITNKIGESTTAPYEFTYAGFDETLAEHKLYMTVTDSDGGVYINLTPTVIKINKNPSCVVSSPVNNTFYSADSTRYISITYTVADPDITTLADGIDSVVYRVNGIKVGDDTGFNSGVSYIKKLPGSIFPAGHANLLTVTSYDKYGAAGIGSVTINSLSASKVAFYDGFESYADFDTSKALKPYNTPSVTNWTQKDLDKGTTYIISGKKFQNQGYKGAFIIFNPSEVDSSNGQNINFPNISNDGNKFAACFSNEQGQGADKNNDWLITKKITVPAGIVNPKVSFWVRSYTAQYGLEKFGVFVSNTGNNVGTGIENGSAIVGDFKKISSSGQAYNYEDAPAKWTNFTYSLNSFVNSSNRDIYIAITCKSTDMFFLMVDDFIVFDGNMPTKTPANLVKKPGVIIPKTIKTTNKTAKRARK